VDVRRIALLLLVLVLVPATVATAAPREAWTTHRSAHGGFSVSTPSTWVDVTRLTPQVLAKLREQPKLAAYAQVMQRTQAVKMILLDAGSAVGGFTTNVNVAQVPTIGDLRLQRDVTVAQLKATGLLVGPAASSFVRLAGGTAVELRYHVRYTAASPLVALLQFIFVRQGQATVLTYTTTSQLERARRSLFLRSARSFRFTA
jgi:hypothetical protein